MIDNCRGVNHVSHVSQIDFHDLFESCTRVKRAWADHHNYHNYANTSGWLLIQWCSSGVSSSMARKTSSVQVIENTLGADTITAIPSAAPPWHYPSPARCSCTSLRCPHSATPSSIPWSTGVSTRKQRCPWTLGTCPMHHQRPAWHQESCPRHPCHPSRFVPAMLSQTLRWVRWTACGVSWSDWRGWTRSDQQAPKISQNNVSIVKRGTRYIER